MKNLIVLKPKELTIINGGWTAEEFGYRVGYALGSIAGYATNALEEAYSFFKAVL